MHRLFYSPAACSMAVHIVLEEIGEPYETELVSTRPGGGTGTAAWKVRNPKGRVPALTGVPGRIGGEGDLLTEAHAILFNLARTHPKARLLPTDPAGEAQLMAADDDASIHLVGPHYAVPSAINSRTTLGRHGDAIHLSADGERWWGEQVGKVMHRVLHRGEDWQPLRPRSAMLDAARDSVVVEFTVPCPPLVLDTDFLPRQEIVTNGGFSSLAGFQVRDRSGQTVALTMAEVAAPTRLRLRFAKPLPTGQTCNISYGHPATTALGSIAAIRSGPETDGQATEELVLTSSFTDPLKVLTDEGAFFVANTSGTATRAPIRKVREENAVTVLRYEPRELRSNTPFAAGQAIVAMRPFSYGNLRDSDAEPSTHTFADAAYGTRAGKPYPLWNWCVLFSNLNVGGPQAQ